MTDVTTRQNVASSISVPDSLPEVSVKSYNLLQVCLGCDGHANLLDERVASSHCCMLWIVTARP